MDSLGGILTKGLLGNMILGRFGLGNFTIEVVDPEGPDTGDPRVWEAGGAGGAVPRRNSTFQPHNPKRRKHIVISLRHKGQVHKKTFEVSDRTAQVSINTLKLLSTVKEATYNVFVRKKETVVNPVVRIKDDRD